MLTPRVSRNPNESLRPRMSGDQNSAASNFLAAPTLGEGLTLVAQAPGWGGLSQLKSGSKRERGTQSLVNRGTSQPGQGGAQEALGCWELLLVSVRVKGRNIRVDVRARALWDACSEARAVVTVEEEAQASSGRSARYGPRAKLSCEVTGQ